MNRDVVEVVTRFGGTLLDVAYVERSDVFRIGTAPDADLAVPGYSSFPLVAQGNVRVPGGIDAAIRGATTILRIGKMTIELTRTKPSARRVARRRPQWRMPLFVVGSLIVQVAIVLVAMALEPLELLVVKNQPRMRYAHIASPPPIDETVPKPKPTNAEAQGAVKAQHAGALMRETTGSGKDIDQVLDGLAKDVDKKLAGLRAENQYDEDADNAKRFGGGAVRFDPSQRPGFESVASGDYDTEFFDMNVCPGKSCKITGHFPLQGVRSYVHEHRGELFQCYQRYAQGPGTVVVEFTIAGTDGSVRAAKGHGLGETGPCAAAVVAAIDFKAVGNDTDVRMPIRFN